jgi:hypothetical protein
MWLPVLLPSPDVDHCEGGSRSERRRPTAIQTLISAVAFGRRMFQMSFRTTLQN